MYNQRSPLRMDEVSRVRNILPLDGIQLNQRSPLRMMGVCSQGWKIPPLGPLG
ncbi:unnamed protein product [Staurois parvus]|uniref:Uncharacterized protein n=1 Tax=Staurois parvus TaxID=386267 RepID=A0ABN9CAM2_9NEOB|nr:unnamed protein product [Staurois parvus]